MQTINRRDAKFLINHREEENLAVVEVLSPEEYQEFHLPGAMNIPLGDDFADSVQSALPDKQQPVLLYCHDSECQASTKAGARMEELGYQKVYDYEAGKVDWKAAGLPIES